MDGDGASFAIRFGRNLAGAREAAGHSQEAVADLAELHRTAVGQLERGERIPRADTVVKLEVVDGYKRPVSATADSHEVRDVVEVTIRESRERTVTLLFDPEHNLEERILAEQFVT